MPGLGKMTPPAQSGPPEEFFLRLLWLTMIRYCQPTTALSPKQLVYFCGLARAMPTAVHHTRR
jgi:hypothetical protein